MQKIISATATVILLATVVCKAQDKPVLSPKEHFAFVSLSGGAGIPAGDYAKFKTITSTAYLGYASDDYCIAGEAKQGFAYKAAAGYMFTRHAGAFVSVFHSSNPAAIKTGQEIYPSYAYENSGYHYDVGNHATTDFLLGATGNVCSDKLTVAIRIAAGIQNTLSPETNVVYTYNNPDFSGTYTTSQPKMTSSNFAFNAGLDLTYNITKRIGITLSEDYVTSHASYSDNIRYVSNFNGITGPLYRESYKAFNYSKNISVFAITAGLCYNLR